MFYTQIYANKVNVTTKLEAGIETTTLGAESKNGTHIQSKLKFMCVLEFCLISRFFLLGVVEREKFMQYIILRICKKYLFVYI